MSHSWAAGGTRVEDQSRFGAAVLAGNQGTARRCQETDRQAAKPS
jgi:hypothetical protein